MHNHNLVACGSIVDICESSVEEIPVFAKGYLERGTDIAYWRNKMSKINISELIEVRFWGIRIGLLYICWADVWTRKAGIEVTWNCRRILIFGF